MIGDRTTLPQQNACARYYTTHVEITPIVLESLSKMVPKSSQNLSKIDFRGGLEATLEPLVCRGCPKTSFLMILLNFGTPFGDQFWVILGIFFFCFVMIFLALSCSQNNRQIFKKGTKNTSGIYLKSDLGSIFYDFLYTVFLNDPTVFLLYFTGLRCSKQHEKHTFGNIFRCFLRTLFWDGFGMTFS